MSGAVIGTVTRPARDVQDVRARLRRDPGQALDPALLHGLLERSREHRTLRSNEDGDVAVSLLFKLDIEHGLQLLVHLLDRTAPNTAPIWCDIYAFFSMFS